MPLRLPFRKKATSRHRPGDAWDLTDLLSAADAREERPQRHLWLIRFMAWVRHEPTYEPTHEAPEEAAEPSTPWPVLRLRRFLNVLEQHDEHRVPVVALLAACQRDLDATSLLADYGFTARPAFLNELGERLRRRLLPATPDTNDLGELFGLLFEEGDATWLRAIDEPTLDRLAWLFNEVIASNKGQPGAPALGWRSTFFDAIIVLASQVRAMGLSSALRLRLSSKALASQPFSQLERAADNLRELGEAYLAQPDAPQRGELERHATYLRALLDACLQAADSVHEHFEEHGISVGLVFQIDQLRARVRRIEALLDCALATQPGPRMAELVADLVHTSVQRRSVRALFARHYSMLARKVAERSAETGEHYITRTRAEYRDMLNRAAGGGIVLAGTTFMKFAVLAIGLPAFWAGFGAGLNYAISFVLIYLLHWTVATKQPAMTAPAMAARLADLSTDEAVEGFVDQAAHLIRSQMAGIIGNLFAVAPMVLLAQLLAPYLFGRPLVGEHSAEHVLESLTLLGPTLWYAAFTGVLLFASSLIAGWAENWFVLHRLDSALRWNPRITARLGEARAHRWATWWRHNISGLTANVSLGLMLGLVPVIASFFALPLDVRHVTLSTGQLFAAAGTLGREALHTPAFWWCAAAIPLTGLLNVGVSFFFAFRVALRSRGIRVKDRQRLMAALRHRLRTQPLSFLVPPRDAK